MLRIPLISVGALDGTLAEDARGPAGKSDFFRLQAHAPTAYAAYRPFAKAIFAALELNEIDRELVVLLTAELEKGAYEWAQHEKIAAALGATRAQIDAIALRDIAAEVFSARQQALLAFARQVVEEVRVSDAVFAAVAGHYSHREIVETLYTIGNYMMLARISEVARLPLDDLNGLDVLREAQKEAAAARA
ncbi:carboxymuconolactone decarboxylase family protein [Sphingomonas sp. 37zxx]|uniref:carboxymuconolactone decarboxylase family protein n=1 Tax=Sphingomonas sp. 37zxx TaxID=1550073 RepID=UPI00068B1ADC|nr:carboxymuconolactone decarboxylase family protein [Sphingomonas sp. 37zxx]